MIERRFPTLLTLLLLLLPAAALAIPACLVPVTTTQPDGTELVLRVHGDEWYHWCEDGDGYAVVQDRDGRWVYADLDRRGGYVATEHVAGAADPAARRLLDRVGRHLREFDEEKIHRRQLFFDRSMPDILAAADRLFESDKQTVVQVPVVLIQYPDRAATQTRASFEDLMNQVGYNGTGSLQDYYEEISYGGLKVRATVVGWFTAQYRHLYYRWGLFGGPTARERSRSLAREAVDAAEIGTGTSLDWQPFDNDLDGEVDVVFVVHQGAGAECGDPDLIWSHAGLLSGSSSTGGTSYAVTHDGKLIDRYVMTAEFNCLTGGHEEIGAFCHEFGHALGLPDLYDVDYSSAGIGYWGLMSFGVWGGNGITPETPVHMCAWSKIELGWIAPRVIPTDTLGVTIPDTETWPFVYKLWTDGSPLQEYFLVENRQHVGFDADLPGTGLAVWHIDEGQRRTDNTDNADETHKLVDLEEADGLAQMDSHSGMRGDADDLFPGGTANVLFDSAGNPNSKAYSLANTQVGMDVLSMTGTLALVDFYVDSSGAPPDFFIRDCDLDLGNEPDVDCAAGFNQSPDLWIDNNGDGVIDAPIPGQVNRLYIRAWNLGAFSQPAQVDCWFGVPTLGTAGGTGGPGTPIVDQATGLSSVIIPSPGPVLPTPGGLGHRVYFNWLVPNILTGTNGYCVGCAVHNADDPQTSFMPLADNNLGWLGYVTLAARSGTTPLKQERKQGTTVFRQEIKVVNSYDATSDFLVEVVDPGGDWDVSPGTELTLYALPPGGEEDVTFDVTKFNHAHRDSARVVFRLYKLPEVDLAGSFHLDLLIDDVPPEPVSEWTAGSYEPWGNNCVTPLPGATLSWQEPAVDTEGYPERVRYYEVYGSTDPALVTAQTPEALLAKTYGDDEPQLPGFQYHVHDDLSVPHYYTVVPVDLAGNRGEAATVASPPIITDVPDVADGSALSQNYPNPFNPQTTIDFTLTRGERVTVSVFDSAGRLVKVLADELYGPGTWSVTWNGRDDGGKSVASGVYFLKLKSASLEDSRKMTLVR